MDEVRVDTDHVLTILSESSMSTSGILRQHGITPKAISDITADHSVIRRRQSGTTQDFVAGARSGVLKAVYFRENLLRDMINILSQAVNRHVILLGPDGVGKRTLAYSLALLMSEGKGPAGLKSLVQIDETALLDGDQKAVRAGVESGARWYPVHSAYSPILRRPHPRGVREVDSDDSKGVSGRRPGDYLHDQRD
jgi:ATP-dependent Clp protease ATP-binding subunit ClpC